MKYSAIVTGGTGGLGATVVARLLDDGWRVVVPSVVEQELERTSSDATDSSSSQADLFDPRRSRTWRPRRRPRGAPLRGLVNLVGGFAIGGRVHETAVDDFEQQFRLNLRSTYLMIQAAVSPMIEAGGGSIVCVGTRAVPAVPAGQRPTSPRSRRCCHSPRSSRSNIATTGCAATRSCQA